MTTAIFAETYCISSEYVHDGLHEILHDTFEGLEDRSPPFNNVTIDINCYETGTIDEIIHNANELVTDETFKFRYDNFISELANDKHVCIYGDIKKANDLVRLAIMNEPLMFKTLNEIPPSRFDYIIRHIEYKPNSVMQNLQSIIKHRGSVTIVHATTPLELIHYMNAGFSSTFIYNSSIHFV
jgi:hypothetical protein